MKAPSYLTTTTRDFVAFCLISLSVFLPTVGQAVTVDLGEGKLSPYNGSNDMYSQHPNILLPLTIANSGTVSFEATGPSSTYSACYPAGSTNPGLWNIEYFSGGLDYPAIPAFTTPVDLSKTPITGPVYLNFYGTLGGSASLGCSRASGSPVGPFTENAGFVVQRDLSGNELVREPIVITGIITGSTCEFYSLNNLNFGRLNPSSIGAQLGSTQGSSTTGQCNNQFPELALKSIKYTSLSTSGNLFLASDDVGVGVEVSIDGKVVAPGGSVPWTNGTSQFTARIIQTKADPTLGDFTIIVDYTMEYQ